ncbi:protein kinase [Streptomyces sp. NPDC005820]|uniref:serine/threonine-protein kinase n=1 Tax=Streptomyces sp. NPDC005820 TaxID=3157069 RepID=UPI0033E4806F
MGGVQPGGQFRPLESGDPAEVAGYRLAARLGSGGMGTVYLSYTPGGHPIALKTIRPELSEDAEFRRRFRQEVQAAQRVQGLHTAPVLDFDTEGDRPWLATAYVPGPSLAAAVAEHGPLPVPSLLLLLAGTAEALSVIHGAGIVHRDLKPSNVLLAADGPRVIDFGIARAADATALTGTGVSLGTPAFMSPEQAAGKEVAPASDVFALGQVAAYAARGTGAYGDGPSHAVLYRIVHEEPDLTGLPAELAFVARCLAKDPADRPSPADLVQLCQDASPTPLRQSGSWLPKAISAQITQRISASAELASPPAPTAPLTQVDQPQQHAAPTVTMPPAPPQVPPQPVTPAYGHPMAPPAHPSPYAQHGPYHAPQAGPYVQPRPGWQPPPRPSGTRRALGIIAGVLLPLAGCTGLLYAVGSTSSSSGSGSDTTSSASAKPLPDPEPVSFKSINIPDGYYIQFADSPPKPQDDDVEIYGSDLYYYDDELHSAGDKIVLLNNAQKGSLKTCREETRYADSVSLSQLSKGSQLCVHTDSGHIALVTFRGTAAESDPSDYVSLDLTIWRNAEEASDS